MQGADPEFVVLNAEGVPVPAHKVGIPGKDAKVKSGSGMYFRDGYNVEINPNASTCRALLGNNIRGLLREVQDRLPRGYRLAPLASFRVNMDDLVDAPLDVVEFGCNPSFDAWKHGTPKTVSIDGRVFSRRMTGGHLHTTANEASVEPYESALLNRDNYPLLVQKFDEFLGVPLAAIYSSPDNWERRRFYGGAGDYRPQRHMAVKNYPEDKDVWYAGVEYRTPPSELFLHHAMVSFALGLLRWVVQEFSTNEEFRQPVSEFRGQQIRDAINEGKNAMDLVQRVPGYYNPDTIAALAKQDEIREFAYLTNPRECHSGFNEYANEWRLPREPLPNLYWENAKKKPWSSGWTYAHGYKTDWDTAMVYA